ncbi:MAG: hypothetical protein EXS58_09505 [Candidatus Latescibacteria bacterium]|nr:hypothetical protein [Candidatus Latescibacterota bacterium]
MVSLRILNWLLPGFLLVAWAAQAQSAEQGYILSAGGVVVDRAEQWAKWTFPVNAVEIDSRTHAVQPRLIFKQTDAIKDLNRFRVLIGDTKAYDKLLKDLNKEERPEPLNIRAVPANVAGVSIVYKKDDDKKGIKAGDPITWYYYYGGIREVGSHPELAANILDGDSNTWWEPSSAVSQEEYEALPVAKRGPIYYFARDAAGKEERVDQVVYDQTASDRRRFQYNSRSLDQWYLEVDLGRVVPVQRIVLRFAEEEVGDPFRQFRILSTPSNSRDAALSLTSRTTTPNVDQRVVEFNLDPDGDGTFVQIHRLRLAITDSKFDKFREISQEEFLQLPVEDQGGIDYYIVNSSGSETRVDKTIYDQVGAERQGRLVYFQRERPRLADIEVWSQGDNIALGILDGGGDVQLTGSFAGTPGFDGLYDTQYLQLVWSPDPRFEDRGVLTVDLGAIFWMDQFRMLGDIAGIDEMVTRTSDGSRDSNGNLRWTEIDRRTGGPIEKELDRLVQARYLTTQIFSEAAGRAGGYNTGDNIAEFQVFGQGYPSEVTLTSPLIELPSGVVLGSIGWDAELPDSALTDVVVRTRTGDRLVEITEYYGSGGEPKTETDYNNLPGSFKGPVVTRLVPGGGWSSWSQRYLRPGEQISSPSPRRFMQVQVQLISKVPDLAGLIRSLQVSFTPPVANQTLAEVWPDEAPVGALQDFELYLRPTFIERQPGGQPSTRFDEILVDGTPIQGLKLVEVSLGQEEDFAQGVTQNFTQAGWRADSGSSAPTYWFAGPSGAQFQALIDPVAGDTLKLVAGQLAAAGGTAENSTLHVQLPRKLLLSPLAAGSRVYNRRIIAEGQEVPVDEGGRLLNQLTYLGLPAEQRGRIFYFSIAGHRADGAPIQELVGSELEYKALPDSLTGEVRYLRKLVGKGGEFPFDSEGNALNEAGYNALPVAERGSIMAAGEMVRLRFRARVLLNGTTIDALVRDSSAPDFWQQVDAGDATSLTPGETLTIAVPFSSRIIQEVAIAPNPFTPNADGINDQAQVRFGIGNLNADRRIEVKIYDLSGRLVWEAVRKGMGEQYFAWDGRDNRGKQVPPGLYLCRIEVDVDAEAVTHQVAHRVIAVAH